MIMIRTELAGRWRQAVAEARAAEVMPPDLAPEEVFTIAVDALAALRNAGLIMAGDVALEEARLLPSWESVWQRAKSRPRCAMHQQAQNGRCMWCGHLLVTA